MANELIVRQNGIGGYVEDNPLSSAATTLTSAALAAMQDIGTTHFAWVVLDPAGISGAPEHVKITAHTAAATTATILRGQGGTAARQHDAGTQWIHGPVAADFVVMTGTGTPEGVIAAPVGALYSRTDGGAGTTLYVKESGAGNTGWVGK